MLHDHDPDRGVALATAPARESTHHAMPVAPAMALRPLTVAIAGGGTGGHLIPGLSLARQLAGGTLGARVVFLTSGKALEERLIREAGFEQRALPARPVACGWLGLARALPHGARAVLAAHRAIGDLAPDVVVGLGGFPAAAPVVAARMHGIPVILLEQNVVPGRANRWLAPLAREIHLQWEGARAAFGGHRGVHDTGSPLRDGVVEAGLSRSMGGGDPTRFGLKVGRRTLLITGGSQGALALNRTATAAVCAMPAEVRRRVQVIHLCGGSMPVAELEGTYASSQIPAAVIEFLGDMPSAYAVADLAIARAGGSTLAELAAAAVPAILVPYPHAAMRHQHANANAFAADGAGLVIDEDDLDVASLAATLGELLADDARLLAMSEAARRLSRPAAAAEIASAVAALADEKRSA